MTEIIMIVLGYLVFSSVAAILNVQTFKRHMQELTVFDMIKIVGESFIPIWNVSVFIIGLAIMVQGIVEYVSDKLRKRFGNLNIVVWRRK